MTGFQVSSRYIGPNVDGQIDALILADAIKSLNAFFDGAAAFALGEDTRARAKVVGFNKASAEIVLNFELLKEGTAAAATLFPILPGLSDIEKIASIVKDGIEILKHLGGEKPRKIFNADRGSVSVENNHGAINVYNIHAVNFITAPGNSGLTKDFLGKPLSSEAESAKIKVNNKVVASVERNDRTCFNEVAAEHIEIQSRTEAILRVIKPTLEGQSQWRFSDGNARFDAKIEDDSFLRRLGDGEEKFGRGDHIRVVLRSEQYRSPRGALRTRHAVEQVLKRLDQVNERQQRF